MSSSSSPQRLELGEADFVKPIEEQESSVPEYYIGEDNGLEQEPEGFEYPQGNAPMKFTIGSRVKDIQARLKELGGPVYMAPGGHIGKGESPRTAMCKVIPPYRRRGGWVDLDIDVI